MALKITQEPTEDRQLSVTVEVEQGRIDQELRKAARKVARDYRIPGFRKGKAPYSVVVQQIGLPTLYNEFIDDLGQEVFKEAIEQESIEPYAMASLTDVEFDPVRYTLVVPLEPEVDLGEYRTLRVDETEPSVDPADVKERMASYVADQADWQEADRPVEDGDLVTVDVKSVLTEPMGDDEETVVLDETDWEITMDAEYPMEPAGLDDQILGEKAGASKSFELSWPEDSQSIYAGKTAKFELAIKSVQAYMTPELTDEIAQTIGPDFETVADLEKSVEEALLEEAQARAENEYMDTVLDALLEQSSLVYPPVVVEDQINAMLNDFKSRLRQAGIPNPEEYLSGTEGGEDEIRESYREDAKALAERNLLISEIVQKEGLVAEDEDIEERIAEFVGDFDSEDEAAVEQAETMAAMFRQGGMRQMLESQVLTGKALDRIRDIAQGKEVPDPKPLADKAEAEKANAEKEAEPEEEADSDGDSVDTE